MSNKGMCAHCGGKGTVWKGGPSPVLCRACYGTGTYAGRNAIQKRLNADARDAQDHR